MLETYVKKILAANIYDLVKETPLVNMKNLSKRLDNSIFIKQENLQEVFSFKIRGAYNKMLHLTNTEKAKGVITASAGNHAQGIALAAQHLGIKATIVMPKITPEIKTTAVKEKGAKVILCGNDFSEALTYALELVEKEGLVYVPPYDDADVIAGQGTIAMEILRQYTQKIDTVFVQVGGGGLIAGISAYLKYLYPHIKIIGVEPEDAACLKAAMNVGERVKLDQVGLFAEGVAVAQIGKLPFEICKKYVDEVITVTTDEICAAIKDIFEDTRGVSEPSGALSLAGLKKYVKEKKAKDQTLICINSGANSNFDRLQHIAERTELGEGKEAILAVTIPEKPGSFLKFCRTIGKRMITEFNYRYSSSSAAHIYVGVSIKPETQDKQNLIDTLKINGYSSLDLSNNELAKLHLRHLGGGLSKNSNEKVYRFVFPERPEALLNFLTKLPKDWNISLFHYRNHGAAYGRVLVAFQIPADFNGDIDQALQKTGYRYYDETENQAFRLFLGG